MPRFVAGFDGGQIEHRFALGVFATIDNMNAATINIDVWPALKDALSAKGVNVADDATVIDQQVLWNAIDEKLRLVYCVS